MQDNASPYVSEDTLQNLDALDIKLIEDWPPYSPDLNPIEILWAIMSREVEKSMPSNRAALIFLGQNIWIQIPQTTINALVQKFPHNLAKVIQFGGNQVHF
jgi:transposase